MGNRHRTLASLLLVGLGLAAWSRAGDTPTATATTARATTAPSVASAAVAKRQAGPRARNRAHLVSVPVTPVGETRSALHPALEAALEVEGEDSAWTTEVHDGVSAALGDDPQLDIDVSCAQTLCRIRMTKPIGSELDWPEIDRLLAPVARGEAIFRAAPDGAMTTGCLYFSAEDTGLPLDSVQPPATFVVP